MRSKLAQRKYTGTVDVNIYVSSFTILLKQLQRGGQGEQLPSGPIARNPPPCRNVLGVTSAIMN